MQEKFNPCSNPMQAFNRNFSYYYEEKMWHLAVLHHDQKAFNLINFNAIVK